jgi:hypothetical protein
MMMWGLCVDASPAVRLVLLSRGETLRRGEETLIECANLLGMMTLLATRCCKVGPLGTIS